MSPTELIIQVLKIAIGLAFGAYFVWWSLQVLDRLAPEDEAPTPTVGYIMKHAMPLSTTKTAPQHTVTTREAAMVAFTKRWQGFPLAGNQSLIQPA
jgi:hypothetical protein